MPKKPYERTQHVTRELFMVSVKALRAASTFKTMICGAMRSMAESASCSLQQNSMPLHMCEGLWCQRNPCKHFCRILRCMASLLERLILLVTLLPPCAFAGHGSADLSTCVILAILANRTLQHFFLLHICRTIPVGVCSQVVLQHCPAF